MKPEDLEAIEKMAVKCIFHECFCGKDASLLCAELRKAWNERDELIKTIGKYEDEFKLKSKQFNIIKEAIVNTLQDPITKSVTRITINGIPYNLLAHLRWALEKIEALDD